MIRTGSSKIARKKYSGTPMMISSESLRTVRESLTPSYPKMEFSKAQIENSRLRNAPKRHFRNSLGGYTPYV
jgi:hypothetical protein